MVSWRRVVAGLSAGVAAGAGGCRLPSKLLWERASIMPRIHPWSVWGISPR